jgi:WD40 repeat protein
LEAYKFNNSAVVDTSEFPTLVIKIKAIKNNSQFIFDKNNILLIENVNSISPESVSPPDNNQFQTVRWKTKINGPSSLTLHRLSVIVFSGSDLGTLSTSFYKSYLSVISITNSKDRFEPDMYFGNLKRGEDTTRGIIVNAPIANVVNNREIPVKIDSIKTYSKYFTYEWYGSSIDSTRPPKQLISPFYYRAAIKFKPDDTTYYRDKFTVYFDGGRKEEINLIGNQFIIPRNTVLQLIKPNGGEIILPCQQYEIKWKGAVKGIPTSIFLSIDNGSSWEQIASTSDSVFLWQVPDLPTNRALIKVKQEFTNTTTKTLKEDDIPVRKIAYRSDGGRVISVNDAGFLKEWDLQTGTSTLTKIVTQIPYPTERIKPLGIDYFDNDTKIYVVYRKESYFGDPSQDSIAFFKIEENQPYLKLQIPQNFAVRKAVLDAGRKRIALVPQTGMNILLLSVDDGSIIRTLTFDKPVGTFTFNKVLDKSAVALLNGEVQILRNEDFSVKDQLFFDDLPLIYELGLSPDGEMLAIGCSAPLSVGTNTNRNEIHVVNIKNKLIIRTGRKSASNPVALEFGPTSAHLIVGSAAQPQIAFWDLPGDEFIGSMSGNDNILTDFKFSPDGHSIATSAASGENLNIRFFTYPEEDQSNGTFRIVRPEFVYKDITLEPAYLASDNERIMKGVICNTGEVPLGLDNSWLVSGKHFRMKKTITPNTIYPGECLDVEFYYHPLDTGKLIDTLVITTCTKWFFLKIESIGLKRNITFLNNMFDFGEICVGDTNTRIIDLFRNDDPVPLKVNFIAIDDKINASFRIISMAKDTILQPGEIFRAEIKFHPAEFGEIYRDVFVFHSDQTFMTPNTSFHGRGLGTVFEFSHPNLVFIPEIGIRKIKIINNSKNQTTIVNAIFSQEGFYRILTKLPLNIAAGGEAEIEIETVKLSQSPVSLNFEAIPCNSLSSISIEAYSGISELTIPKVEADPKGRAIIPINFTNSENRQYNGLRFFEAEITINSRLFLPDTVKSDYGTAKLTRNEIVEGKRIIGIKIEGDFPVNGKVAEISGYAGLGETDTSSIEFVPNGKFWGVSVQTKLKNGFFQLINLCEGRYILQNEGIISGLTIIPNPVANDFILEFESIESGIATVEIFNNSGSLVLKQTNIEVNRGQNKVNIDASLINSGSYKLVVKIRSSFSVKELIIIR